MQRALLSGTKWFHLKDLTARRGNPQKIFFSNFGKALFHLKKESIPPQAEPITPESLLQIEINPNDTPNELREKAAFLLSSYYAEAKIYRDHYVWLDIVQHLAFERNGQNNVSREDLVGLIEALKDPANEGGELDLKSNQFLLKDDHRYNKSLKIE